MKKQIIGIFAVLLIGLMAMTAIAVPVGIDFVKIDGDEVADNTLLDVDRDSGMDIRVQFTPEADVENMYIEAFVSGYEYGVLSDTETIRDLEAGKTYKANMHLDFPLNMDQDEYKLRIIMHDRNGELKEWTYDLDMGAVRHGLQIKDVIFEPENSVLTGRSLIANARIKNVGEKDEESIKVMLSIPALGLSDSEFIDDLEAGDSITSEALHIRIPECENAGEYEAILSVEFNEGASRTESKTTIVVADGNVCEAGGVSTVKVGLDEQDIAQGASASFPVTIKNAGNVAKQYTIVVDGADAFGSAAVASGAVVTIQPGEESTSYVVVSADKKANLGEKMFTISVEANGATLSEKAVTANIVKGAGSASVVDALEIGLIVLIVLVIILGLIVGFNKMKSNDDDEDEQTYY